jgi:hypothetical protein
MRTMLEAAGVETSLKDDKHGLGLAKRNKKRFAAQQMLTLLAALQPLLAPAHIAVSLGET